MNRACLPSWNLQFPQVLGVSPPYFDQESLLKNAIEGNLPEEEIISLIKKSSCQEIPLSSFLHLAITHRSSERVVRLLSISEGVKVTGFHLREAITKRYSPDLVWQLLFRVKEDHALFHKEEFRVSRELFFLARGLGYPNHLLLSIIVSAIAHSSRFVGKENEGGFMQEVEQSPIFQEIVDKMAKKESLGGEELELMLYFKRIDSPVALRGVFSVSLTQNHLRAAICISSSNELILYILRDIEKTSEKVSIENMEQSIRFFCSEEVICTIIELIEKKKCGTIGSHHIGMARQYNCSKKVVGVITDLVLGSLNMKGLVIKNKMPPLKRLGGGHKPFGVRNLGI